MRFEHHAFISYAHLDDRAVEPGEAGWVTRFHRHLAAYLGTELGAEARLWRDERLHGDQVFGDAIVSRLQGTALLIAVLTPRFLRSDWCRRELETFCRAASARGGLVVDEHLRVLCVLLRPLDDGDRAGLPRPLAQQATLGYPFFEEVEGRRVLRLDPALGNGARFSRHVLFLAQDIAALIERLERLPDAPPTATPPAGAPAPAAATGVAPGDPSGPAGGAAAVLPATAAPAGPAPPTVYLAECSVDLREARDRLLAELRAHGCTVLPGQRLPETQAEVVAEVDRLLADCALAIHPIGAGYGTVPDGPTLRSVAQLQNDVAIRASQARGLRRLIWLPEGVVPTPGPQADFVAALQADAGLQVGADLVCGSLERLKTVMHATLAALQRPAEPAPPAHPATLHLLCDARDRRPSLPLRRHLQALGAAVELPVFEGDAAALRATNQQLVADSRVVLVFYGAGGEAWKRSTDHALARQLALLRAQGAALPQVWTWLAAPDGDDKADLAELAAPGLIDARGWDGADAVQAQRLLAPLLPALGLAGVATVPPGSPPSLPPSPSPQPPPAVPPPPWPGSPPSTATSFSPSAPSADQPPAACAPAGVMR